jgi:hypothetical protein
MLAQNSTVVLCLIARNPFLPEMVLTLIVPILLVAIVFHLLPNLTRRDIFFAVTVDQAFRKSAEARNIIRRFRLAIWIHTAIALAILFAGVVVGNPFVTLIGIPWQIIGATHAFLRARKQIMPHSATPISPPNGTVRDLGCLRSLYPGDLVPHSRALSYSLGPQR